MSASPRRTRLTLVAVGLIALATVAVVATRPARPRGFATMSHSHPMTVVRAVAPHLGAVGEALLTKDCGSCHTTRPPSIARVVPIPSTRPADPPCLLPHGPGADRSPRSCVRCHAPASRS